VTNFSKEQLDKIRGLLEKVGVNQECPTCKKGTLVMDRGQFGLMEVTQLRENPAGASGGAGSTGRIATCVLFACNTCGFVRMHALTALDLDSMV
jgi:ssDNA-binding Zn-finger/Zn-ribbon topoisomerase 1